MASAFEYKARNAEGRLIEGVIDAHEEHEVASQLQAQGLVPLTITPMQDENDAMVKLNKWLADRSIRPEEIILFSRQMYSLTKSGVPLSRGIRSLAQSIKHPSMKAALIDLADKLEAGTTLSVAMREHPRIFNGLYRSLIGVGENTGRLDQAFLQLAEYIERDYETAKQVKQATRYPMFVIIFMIGAVAIVNIKVIPNFALMFSKFGAELPLPTRILLGTSEFFVAFWPHMTVALAALVGGWLWYISKPPGQVVWDKMKFRIPIVGDIIERSTMSRYCRSLAMMMSSGVPLIQALDLCKETVNNLYLAQHIDTIRERVSYGESLYQTHASTNLFPPLVMQMISVGEETGSVDTLLVEIASHYEREVEYDLKKLTDKIEPILIVVLAVLVLILALGIFIPMWDMAKVYK